MEQVQSHDETSNGVSTDHAKLREAIENIHKAMETPSRLQQAKDITSKVAIAARELDKAVENVGKFFETILETELSSDQLNQQLTQRGFPEPTETDLGIPNALDEAAFDKFDLATNQIINSPDNEVRKQAMFLVSFCNQLMFERGLLDSALLKARQQQRKTIGEFMKYRLRADNARSQSITNFRTQG